MDKGHKIELVCLALAHWSIFEQWKLSWDGRDNYSLDMEKWISEISACKDFDKWAESVPEDVLIFIEKMIGGEDKKA
jgi:hypothetical protein